MFYDDSILSGTKTVVCSSSSDILFYDDSILSGTKTEFLNGLIRPEFYDDSILSGTKTDVKNSISSIEFYDDSILSGTKTSNRALHMKNKNCCTFLFHKTSPPYVLYHFLCIQESIFHIIFRIIFINMNSN